jgi:hypothetical protein
MVFIIYLFIYVLKSAQVAVWLGEWNVFQLDNYSSDTGDLLMLTALTLFGILGMFAANSYVSSSWIITDFHEGKPRVPTATLLLQAQATLGMLSYLTFVNGLWVLLDVYGFESTLLRNLLYTLVGCVACFVAGSLANNFMLELELLDETTSYSSEDTYEMVANSMSRSSYSSRSYIGDALLEKMLAKEMEPIEPGEERNTTRYSILSDTAA